MARGPVAVRLRPRSTLVLVLASLAGLVMFTWPLVVPAGAGLARGDEAPLLLALVLPVLVAVVLAELSEGGMDASAVALLGVLSAVNAGLRLLGAGLVGIETVFFLLVLAARVLGPGFGFLLGCTSLLASALLTGGVGPWLPFQMVAAGWVGLGAGLLPRRPRGRWELALLAAYGVLAAYAYGLALDLWFWPTVTAGTGISFVAGDPVLENLRRFGLFALATTVGWDTGRALTTAVAVVLAGPLVLPALRRTARRATFGSSCAVVPEPSDGPGTTG